MSDSERIQVLVETRNADGDESSLILNRGQVFDLEGTDITVTRVEVRPAEDQEIKADGGTETIDESQTVREAVQPLVTTLRGCRRSDHCHRLAEVVTGAATVDSLGFEDLFYPMRCHHDDGLVLRVEGPSGQNWLQYGSGDLFYWMTDDERTMESAVDPFELWDAISPGSVEVDPVLVENTPYGEDDDPA
jgi:hypothetical protein